MPRIEKRQRLAGPLFCLATAAVLFAVNALSVRFGRLGAPVASIWPGDAILLLFMLARQGRGAWTRLTAGLFAAFCANSVNGDQALISACLSAANVLGVALVFIGMRAGGGRPNLRRTAHLLRFLVLAGGAASLSGVVAAGALALLADGDFAPVWTRWALADGLGYLVITPLILVLRPSGMARLRSRFPLPSIALAMLGYLALALIVFSQRRYPVLFLIPFGLFVIAYLYELEGVVLAVLATAVIATTLAMVGRGPSSLVPGSNAEQLLVLQMFLATITLSILPISSVMGERRRLRVFLIAARDRARDAARRAQELNKLALMAEDIAGVGHWRRDLRTGEAIWSEQVFRILGFDPTMPPPPFDELMRSFPPETGAAMKRAFGKAYTTTVAGALEFAHVRLDGQERYIALHFACDRDRDGVAGLFGLIRDVTDERRLELELRQARQAAEAASSMKSDFLANVSHELRTPLASILGFTSLLRQRGGLTSEDQAHAERISTAGKALLTTVNDILMFSEVEAQEVDIRRVASNPLTVATEAIDLFRSAADAKNLALSFTALGQGLPTTVSVDARRVRQVLINLISNAVKFTDVGAVKVEAAYDAGSEVLSFTVADTGPGLAQDQLQLLFQRFSSVGRSMRRTNGGAGLGLAISKGLVEAMGGNIVAHSELAQGSRFRFTVPAPVVSAPVERDVQDGAGTVLRPAIRSLLLADDREDNRALVQAILRPLELEVTEAANGVLLGAMAEARRYDLLLIDLHMPEVSGVEAVRLIRSGRGPNRDSLIIATSTAEAASSMDELRAAGFDGFMAKPFPPDVLIRLVLKPAPIATIRASSNTDD